MFRSQPERAALAACALLALGLLGAPALRSAAPQLHATTTGSQLTTEAEHAAISAWRTKRADSLTSDTGWLTLAGLLWLKPGDNSFGRGASNALVLDNAALADTAGSFVLTGGKCASWLMWAAA
jgi:uncharacterized protein